MKLYTALCFSAILIGAALAFAGCASAPNTFMPNRSCGSTLCPGGAASR